MPAPVTSTGVAREARGVTSVERAVRHLCAGGGGPPAAETARTFYRLRFARLAAACGLAGEVVPDLPAAGDLTAPAVWPALAVLLDRIGVPVGQSDGAATGVGASEVLDPRAPWADLLPGALSAALTVEPGLRAALALGIGHDDLVDRLAAHDLVPADGTTGGSTDPRAGRLFEPAGTSAGATADRPSHSPTPRRGARHRTGAWYTPPEVVDAVLDLTLDPWLDGRAAPRGRRRRLPTVLDPAVGTGAFLITAVERLRLAAPERNGAELLAAVHGVDLDPVAVEVARLSLWLAVGDPTLPLELTRAAVRCGDALTVELGPVDIVVGNPPFASPRRRAGARGPTGADPRTRRFGDAVTATTDVAAVFLALAVDALADGGRAGLVLPLSTLAATGAAGVRRRVLARTRLEALWLDGRPRFAAAVRTCAPVLVRRGPEPPGGDDPALRTRRGAEQPRTVLVVVGADTDPGGPSSVHAPHPTPGRATWGPTAAPAFGIPAVSLDGPGVLGDLVVARAGFRDEYYALADHVLEGGAGLRADDPDGWPGGTLPIVTSGLLDVLGLRWGTTPTRLHRRHLEAPLVRSPVTPDLGWGRLVSPKLVGDDGRLVPKVLVGTQGRLVPVAVDTAGQWFPSVPVVSLTARPEVKVDLWAVAAVVAAPPVVANVAATTLGAALSPGAVKLGARDLEGLPLPADAAAWRDAAEAARSAQLAALAGDDAARAHALDRFGAAAVAAYGLDRSAGRDVLAWWTSRRSRRSRGGGRGPRSGRLEP